MRFGPRRSFYKKSSGGQNLYHENFQFQIISKPFDRSTSYWYQVKQLKGILLIYFSLTLTQGQIGSQVNMGSYLKTYLTQRLHTWYQDTTQ